jgi:hypothetical protein
MEVREMVNDTLGGRDLGIPYCTLCGAAQAYFTDATPPGVERPVLRTSGLLTATAEHRPASASRRSLQACASSGASWRPPKAQKPTSAKTTF